MTFNAPPKRIVGKAKNGYYFNRITQYLKLISGNKLCITAINNDSYFIEFSRNTLITRIKFMKPPKYIII